MDIHHCHKSQYLLLSLNDDHYSKLKLLFEAMIIIIASNKNSLITPIGNNAFVGIKTIKLPEKYQNCEVIRSKDVHH